MKRIISLHGAQAKPLRETKWFQLSYRREEFKPGKFIHNLVVEHKSGDFPTFEITLDHGPAFSGEKLVSAFADNLPATVDAGYLKSFAKKKGYEVSESKNKTESVTVTLSGNANSLTRVLAFLAMLRYNGQVGHSGMFALGWDGDGSDRLDIDSPDIDAITTQLKEGFNACSSTSGDIEYMGDLGSFGVACLQPNSRRLVWTARDGKID